jgi:hypothetical protein
MADESKLPLFDPSLFKDLKNKIDEESKVRDRIFEVVRRLNDVNAYAQALLSRVHATPRARCESLAGVSEAPTTRGRLLSAPLDGKKLRTGLTANVLAYLRFGAPRRG